MSYIDRRLLIQRLQRERAGTHVITYLTSTRPGLDSHMAMDAIRKIDRHLHAIPTPRNKTIIDLYLHSNGGDGVVPWRLVTLIREYCKEFNVIIPHRAFSAATLTAIGADHIIMHPMGILGPTDPKVSNEFNPTDPSNAQRLGISVEDVISYISLVKEELGIHREEELVKALGFLAGENRIHPLALGNVKRFYSQSRMMAKKLLELHMNKSKESHKITEIADNLNSKLYFHGHPINKKEAKDLGLKIENSGKRLHRTIWDLYEEYEKEMMLEQVFDPNIELKKKGALPIITNYGQFNSTKIDKDMSIVYIESEYRSDVLQITLQLEGYRTPIGNGLRDVISLSQTRNEWKVELPQVLPVTSQTNSVVGTI